jgi:mannose-6-phosphate isomerase-like protein (cupin superfamily)
MEKIKIINSEKILPIETNEDGIIITPILTPDDGAQWRSSIKIHLKKNKKTKSIKLNSECVFFVLKGEGIIFDETENRKTNIKNQKMVFITPNTSFSLLTSSEELVLLGGPCPFDKNILTLGD